MRFDDLKLSSTAGGCRLEVKAKPGARKEGIAGIHDGALRIGVNAAPEKGKANQAIRKFLGKFFGVAPAKVELVSGPTSQQKIFFLPLTSREVLDILHEKEKGL